MTASAPASSAAARTGSGKGSTLGQRAGGLLQRLDRPLTSYYLIFGTTALLVALGLIMVLSASMIDSYTTTGSAYSLFQKQAFAASIGLPLMVIASHLPLRIFRWMGYPAMLASVAGLVLVLFQGVGHYGAVRWIEIGGLTMQPSEPAKLAFILWGANLLARKEELKELVEWRHLLIPLLPGCGVLVLLVLLGSDLGTTCILLVVFLALLWVVGAPARLFVAMMGLVLFLVAIMVVVAPYRLSRITSFLNPQADPTDAGFQAMHGLYALGTGGLFGVGIGASREKWGLLPHPESDFIFAILGEELGLVGTLLVIGLYGVLGYAGLRVASRTDDPFSRLVASSMIVWFVVQALINIGAVIGILPITGIPLPLVSYGGSALVPTLIGLGILLALAKKEPDARKVLRARGPSRVQRALSWLGLHDDDSTGPRPQPRSTRQAGSRPMQGQARRNRRR